jgi:sugar O-acyltransferase (sialic acid O-acetyltransferase NeuD family)
MLRSSPKDYEGAVIYGAGSHARELSEQLVSDNWEVNAFVDDFQNNRLVAGFSVLSFQRALDLYRSSYWFIAIGSACTRKILADRLTKESIKLGTYISSNATVFRSASIGIGSQVFARSVISSDVRIGNCVIVNFGCVISHDVEVQDFATLSPGVFVAGNVGVGSGTLLGVGASVKNGDSNAKLSIGDNVVVGAGSCVVGNIDDNSIVAGVPARPLNRRTPA